MRTTNPTSTLRRLLILDAATCLAMGVLLVVLSGPLTSLTAIPPAILVYAGVALIPIAAFMGFTAGWAAHSSAAVRLIVVGNVLWVLGSLGLMFGGWVTPNALGMAFIGAQAAVVAVLTALEYAMWRRIERRAAGPSEAFGALAD